MAYVCDRDCAPGGSCQIPPVNGPSFFDTVERGYTIPESIGSLKCAGRMTVMYAVGCISCRRHLLNVLHGAVPRSVMQAFRRVCCGHAALLAFVVHGIDLPGVIPIGPAPSCSFVGSEVSVEPACPIECCFLFQAPSLFRSNRSMMHYPQDISRPHNGHAALVVLDLVKSSIHVGTNRTMHFPCPFKKCIAR